jgi:hypothetical protein
MDQVHPITLRPGDKPGALHITLEKRPFVDVVAEALGVKKMRVVETGDWNAAGAASRTGGNCPWAGADSAHPRPTTKPAVNRPMTHERPSWMRMVSPRAGVPPRERRPPFVP